MLPEVWVNLQYPDKDQFEKISKRRLHAISKIVGTILREKYFIKYKKKGKQHWEFTDDQLKTLFASFKTLRYYMLFRVQYLLALRIGEVIRLKWQDIDLEKKELCLVNSKSKALEKLPLSDEVVCLLKRWKYYREEGVEWVFPAVTKPEIHIAYTLADKRFKETIRRAGLPEWGHPHCLRHTRLSKFYRFSKNWELTRMLARHKSAHTTFEYYVHASYEELRNAYDSFSDTGKLKYKEKQSDSGLNGMVESPRNNRDYRIPFSAFTGKQP